MRREVGEAPEVTEVRGNQRGRMFQERDTFSQPVCESLMIGDLVSDAQKVSRKSFEADTAQTEVRSFEIESLALHLCLSKEPSPKPPS